MSQFSDIRRKRRIATTIEWSAILLLLIIPFEWMITIAKFVGVFLLTNAAIQLVRGALRWNSVKRKKRFMDMSNLQPIKGELT